MKISRVSKFLLLLIMLQGLVAQAQMDRGQFKTSKEPTVTNLLKEGDSVAVLNEESVQEKKFSSRRTYAFLGGQAQADHLTLTSHEHRITYDLSQPMNTVGVEVGIYPFMWNGLWGLKGAVSYGNMEQTQGKISTMLHVASGDLLLMYRGEQNRRSWVKPFGGLGTTLITAIQRGTEEYNTSEARGMGLGVIGLGFNLNRLFRMDSMLDWELMAQYKRTFGPSKSSADWTGSAWNAGISLAL